MKFALALTLFLVADGMASATTQPTLMVCTLQSYTTKCNPRLPMPCPNGPQGAATVVVNEKIEVATDDSYVAARATAAKDVTIEGARFKVTADGGYSMNSDGSLYLPTLTLQVRDETSGWTTESHASEHTNLALTHSSAADKSGNITTIHGVVDCRLQ